MSTPVWCIMDCPDGRNEYLVAIFSSKEKAEEAFPHIQGVSCVYRPYIVEAELDPQPESIHGYTPNPEDVTPPTNSPHTA